MKVLAALTLLTSAFVFHNTLSPGWICWYDLLWLSKQASLFRRNLCLNDYINAEKMCNPPSPHDLHKISRAVPFPCPAPRCTEVYVFLRGLWALPDACTVQRRPQRVQGRWELWGCALALDRCEATWTRNDKKTSMVVVNGIKCQQVSIFSCHDCPLT